MSNFKIETIQSRFYSH